MGSRDKGASGENEFLALMDSKLPNSRMHRNLRQYQEPDEFDLISDDPSCPLGFEVKRRREVGFKPQWLEQAARASKKSGLYPVLAYRFDRRSWWLALPANVVAIGYGWDHKEYDDFTGWMHMDADTFFPLALEIWVNEAARDYTVCPQCDGSGISIATISDPSGFADDIEVEEVCWFCKGVS